MRKFLLVLNAVKNTVYIEKCFKQKLREIEFSQKTQQTLVFIYPRNGVGGWGGFKDLHFLKMMHRRGRKTFTSF